MRSVAIMSRLQVSVIQMCSSVQTSVCIKHLQWQSPLILMYAVMKDMHVVYMIFTMCVLFVCLYIAAHCRTPECKSVRPDWSFRTLLRSSSVSTIVEYYSVLNEHYRSTTPCSMPILNNTVLKKYFSIYWCVLLRSNSMSTIVVLLRAQWALLTE